MVEKEINNVIQPIENAWSFVEMAWNTLKNFWDKKILGVLDIFSRRRLADEDDDEAFRRHVREIPRAEVVRRLKALPPDDVQHGLSLGDTMHRHLQEVEKRFDAAKSGDTTAEAKHRGMQ